MGPFHVSCWADYFKPGNHSINHTRIEFPTWECLLPALDDGLCMCILVICVDYKFIMLGQ